MAIAEFQPVEKLVQSSIRETIGDFERPLFYSTDQTAQLLQRHQEISQWYGTINSYCEFTDQGEPLLYDLSVDNVHIKVGPIGAFSSGEIARMIQEQATTYVTEGTMGKQFPKNDPEKVQELISIMIGGFKPDRIIVLYEMESDEGILPVTGVQAFLGNSELPIGQVMLDAQEEMPSSLSTLQSLRIQNPSSPSLQEFLTDYGQVTEEHIVCMSRLFRADRPTSQAIRFNRKTTAWEAMALLALGIDKYTRRHGIDTQIALYDTHTDKIQGQLAQLFGMQLLSRNGELVATNEVQNSILHHHYGPAAEGGWIEDILIGRAVMADYVPKAKTYLESVGIQIEDSNNNSDQLSDFEILMLTNPDVVEHLTEQETFTPESPEVNKPSVINVRTQKGLRTFTEIAPLLRKKDINNKSFLSSQRELQELFEFYSKLPTSANGIKENLASRIFEKTQGLSRKDIKSVISTGSLAKDLARFVRDISRFANPDFVESHTRWIYDPLVDKLTQYVDPHNHRLLQESRLLGLVPMQTIQTLRSTRIRAAGASAAAHTLDLLTAMGAENIHFRDAGLIDSSNLTRFPGGMASIHHNGEAKVVALQRVLQGRNPYGDFRGFFGKVTDHISGPFDITPIEFASDADLASEVVDGIPAKISFRKNGRTNYPTLPFLFLADVGHNAFAGIEVAGNANHFNRNITDEQLDRMAEIKGKSDVLRAVVHMLGDQFPSEHQLQFIYFDNDLMSSWSQDGIAAHESAAVSAAIILNQLGGVAMHGKNHTVETMPKSAMPGFDSKEKCQILASLMAQLFPEYPNN